MRWQGWRSRSTPPCQISPHRCRIVAWVPPPKKKLIIYEISEYKRLTGAYLLREFEFYEIFVVCGQFILALTIRIWWIRRRIPEFYIAGATIYNDLVAIWQVRVSLHHGYTVARQIWPWLANKAISTGAPKVQNFVKIVFGGFSPFPSSTLPSPFHF